MKRFKAWWELATKSAKTMGWGRVILAELRMQTGMPLFKLGAWILMVPYVQVLNKGKRMMILCASENFQADAHVIQMPPPRPKPAESAWSGPVH